MGCVGGGASETLFVTLFKVSNITPPRAWAILMKLRKKSIRSEDTGSETPQAEVLLLRSKWWWWDGDFRSSSRLPP